MYKKLMNKIKKDLSSYFAERHLYLNDTNGPVFLGFYEDIVFRISFDTAGYGSRFEMILEFETPLVKKNFQLFPKHFLETTVSVESQHWSIEKDNKSKEEIEKSIDRYLADIVFMYEKYFLPIISREINAFDMEKCIAEEYHRLFDSYLEEIGEEDPAWEYTLEFMASGKSQDEWSEEDSKKCEQLTKEKQDKEFPYEKVRSQILQTIEQNRPIYHKELEKYFDGEKESVVFDKTIYPTTLEAIIEKGAVEQRLAQLGFATYERNIQGLVVHGEVKFYKKDDIELRLTLSNELFLDFIITQGDKSKRVNVYDGGFFWFGWLMGQENTFEENLNKAFEKLEQSL
jgi:hypothetical protein